MVTTGRDVQSQRIWEAEAPSATSMVRVTRAVAAASSSAAAVVTVTAAALAFDDSLWRLKCPQ